MNFARYALFASLVASALGGVAMCVLVLKFGFAPPDDEPVDDRHRRLFATHLGHAFAAVAFALTAVFTVIALLSGPATRPRGSGDDVAALEGRLEAWRPGCGGIGSSVSSAAAAEIIKTPYKSMA